MEHDEDAARRVRVWHSPLGDVVGIYRDGVENLEPLATVQVAAGDDIGAMASSVARDAYDAATRIAQREAGLALRALATTMMPDMYRRAAQVARGEPAADAREQIDAVIEYFNKNVDNYHPATSFATYHWHFTSPSHDPPSLTIRVMGTIRLGLYAPVADPSIDCGPMTFTFPLPTTIPLDAPPAVDQADFSL